MAGLLKTNILLIYANSSYSRPLRLDAEAREIQQALKHSKYHDTVHLVTRPAATIEDLSDALLEEHFRIVHISGHGEQRGLILVNEQGGECLVPSRILTKHLQRYLSIECVILNACYSARQGRQLSSFIPFTIVMDGLLDDETALVFSQGFYKAIGAGHSIEAAYQEGLSRLRYAAPSARPPKLLVKKEVGMAPQNFADEAEEASERTYIKAGKFLIGFAVDLSGSMSESIRNRADTEVSRLKSLDQSLNDLMKNARESIQESRDREIETSLDLFVYGFGLRTMPVCDLLSLIKAGRQLITDDLIEEYTQNYKEMQQAKYRGYEGTSDLVRNLGLGALWSTVERVARRIGKDAVLRRILNDLRPALEARAREIGDTTLPLEEVAQLWESSEVRLSNIKELIFGNTPAKTALGTVVERFQRELQKRAPETQSILFWVSDGKFTDTDLLPLAKRLQSMGVSIVSCFISDQDIANPRELHGIADPRWGPEAQVMFQLASPLGERPEVRRYLLEHNWTIYPQPKLFVQLNHSDVLREFVRVTLSMIEDSETAPGLSRGW